MPSRPIRAKTRWMARSNPSNDDIRVQLAERANLKIVDVDELTIRRDTAADGFRFIDVKTNKNVDPQSVKHLSALVIPPAWTDVTIATDPLAHILAVGRDEAGRTQYIYHPDWEHVRNAIKTRRLLEFGLALPKLRQNARRLRRARSHKKTALGLAIELLDRAAMRPGSEAHLANTGARGLTTIARKQVRIENNNTVRMSYPGKGGQHHRIKIKDAALAKQVRAVRNASPNGRFFAFRDGSKLTAPALNNALQALSGREISSKDFRTFRGSSEALGFLYEWPDRKPRRSALPAMGRHVAQLLRNTPAVARSSYVHPLIVDAFENEALDRSLFSGSTRKGLSRNETALMRLLERETV